MADYSQRSLVEISRIIFEHVKAQKSNGLVINHVWPPFDPSPYYGLYNDSYRRRSPTRLKPGLEIALRYGEGSLVLCTLQAPWEDREIKRVVQETLRES